MKALFFDLDDTLYDTKRVHESGVRRAWERWNASGAPALSWPEFQAAYDRARADVKALIPGSPSFRSRLLYFKRLTELQRGRCLPRLALALDEAYCGAWEEIRWVDGLAPLLQRLASRFDGLGIISNNLCAPQLQKLSRLDPEGRLFRWMVTSEEAGCEKPSAAIFREALRRADCLASDAIMVGDDWTADIEGARAAGLRAVYVSPLPPRGGEALPPGVHWIRALRELEELKL